VYEQSLRSEETREFVVLETRTDGKANGQGFGAR
jgi:hypothetical protein